MDVVRLANTPLLLLPHVILLAEGAQVMITRNLWTSKGTLSAFSTICQLLNCVQDLSMDLGYYQKDLVLTSR